MKLPYITYYFYGKNDEMTLQNVKIATSGMP